MTAPTSITVGQRVFTVGHSFHSWVAPILLDLAQGAGIHGHQVAGLAMVGGSSAVPPYVLHHWNIPEPANTIKPALRSGQVDVLTLSPIWLPDAGISLFTDLALQNPAVRVIVQAYWLPNDMYDPVYPLPTRLPINHNATDLHTLRAAHVPYFQTVIDEVSAINARLDRTVVYIAPVGAAVLALREHIAAGAAPGLQEQWDIFHDSWGHPLQPIQLLAAYCHFAIIYRRTPVGLPAPRPEAMTAPWPAKRDWRNPDLLRLLQQLAWDAVVQSPYTGVRAV